MMKKSLRTPRSARSSLEPPAQIGILLLPIGVRVRMALFMVPTPHAVFFTRLEVPIQLTDSFRPLSTSTSSVKDAMWRLFLAFGCMLWVTATVLRSADTLTKPAAANLPPAAPSLIDFQRDIKPIFVKSCISCHGPAKHKGGLRLDDGTEAMKGGNSGAVIKAGDAAHSRLLLLVAGLDADRRMPP